MGCKDHTATPRGAARQLVQRFLPAHPPVLAERICAALGIAVQYVDMASAGYTLSFAGRSTIFLSRRTSLPRRRFTLAHEMGHLVLDHGSLLLEGNHPLQERHADIFAAELLMPPELLAREIFRLSTLGLRPDVASLARTFVVSRESMAIRCRELGWAHRLAPDTAPEGFLSRPTPRCR